MSKFTYQLNSNSGYIELLAKGDAEPSDVITMYADAVTHAKEYTINKILLDARKLRLNFPPIGVVDVLHKLHDVFEDIYLARVISEQDMRNGLIESYSEQRSLKIKNFESLELAIDWLHQS